MQHNGLHRVRKTPSREGIPAPTIAHVLLTEGSQVSRHGVSKFFTCYKKDQKPGKAVWQQKDNQMGADYESSATQLPTSLLISHGHNLSLSTVLRCRTTLGLTFCGSTYCQLIRTANKAAHLGWARQYLGKAGHGFMDIIWTDECSVQMESHRRFCCRKNGDPPKYCIQFSVQLKLVT